MSKQNALLDLLLSTYVGLSCNFCKKKYIDIATIKDLDPVRIGKSITDTFETACWECYKKAFTMEDK